MITPPGIRNRGLWKISIRTNRNKFRWLALTNSLKSYDTDSQYNPRKITNEHITVSDLTKAY